MTFFFLRDVFLACMSTDFIANEVEQPAVA